MKYNCCTDRFLWLSTATIANIQALCFILLNLPTSQGMHCLHLREKCRSSEDECEGLWNTTERMCEFSGVNCQIKYFICNSTVFYFTEKYPEFKACTCPEDIYCSIKKLFGKNCNPKNEHTVPEESIKQEISITQQGFMHRTKITDATSSAKANDCSLAKQFCKENHNCFSLYKNFESQCTHSQECFLNEAGHSCLTAWTELKKTVMGNCVCLNSTKRKCVKVWNSIYNNTCLQQAKERHISMYAGRKRDSSVPDQDFDPAQLTINLEWEKSSLKNIEYEGPISCLDVAAICIGDSVCNRYLAALMKACTVSENVCHVKDCQRTIQAFYETMPFNVSQMLAFCHCNHSHEDCQRARDVLHSKSCTVHTDVPISCLHLVSSCLEDELCRKRYRNYHSKCWDHDNKCHNNKQCLLRLNKEAPTSSESEECRAAYIGTLGTTLQTPCTCNAGLDYEDQRLCVWYSHILHNKPHLNRVSARNIHASYSDTQEKQQIMIGSHTFKSDALVYIIAYTSGILLISGIILLTLLQTRACRTQKKSTSPRENASESLMNT